MDKFLLNPSTRESIQRITASSPHAIGISGSSESGKKYITSYIAEQILNVSDIKNYPHVKFIDGKNAGIDEVREVSKFMSLKLPGKSKYKKLLVFWSFEKLSLAAQNAFLKSLEEPAEATLIIINTNAKNKLLPTTISRASWIEILPVSIDDTIKYFIKDYDEKTIRRAYGLSDGRVGMLSKLLDDYEQHPSSQSVESVKNILRLERFERLVEIDRLVKNKEFNIELYLSSLAKVLEAVMKTKIEKTGKIDKKAVSNIKRIMRAKNSLSYNVNQKLILTDIFYNL